MSRVHDALKKAAQEAPPLPKTVAVAAPPPAVLHEDAPAAPAEPVQPLPPPPRAGNGFGGLVMDVVASDIDDLDEIIRNAQVLPYNPLKEALLVNPATPREAPAEEFRSLRTRLNHLQTLQPLHTLVVTSASPAEGKSFTATNLAVTEAQLAEKRVLLADFDFRRPTVEKTFQISPSPGITDYLVGK